MNLQYVTNSKGIKNAVLLSIKDWDEIKQKLDEFDRLRNKKNFLIELQEAVDEMKLIKEGRLKARNVQELLDEL